jgi:outer membrane protein TolC
MCDASTTTTGGFLPLNRMSLIIFLFPLATIPELVSAQSELAAARSERTLAIADYLTAIASLTLAMGSPATTASKEGSSSKYPPTPPSVPPSTKPQKTPAHF